MRVTYSYQGREEVRSFERSEVLIGRLSPLSAPDLDFGVDPTVSRKHARITINEGEVWIEDLRSTNGTVVDGEYIENTQITSASVIRVGETSLHVEFTPPPAAAKPRPTPVMPKPAAGSAAPAGGMMIPSVNVMMPPGTAPAPAPAASPAGILPPKPGILPPGTPAVVKPPSPTPVVSPAPASAAPPAAPRVAVVAKPAPTPPPAPVVEAPAETATADEAAAPLDPPAPPAPAASVAPVGRADTAADLSFKRRLASLYQVPLSFTAEMRMTDMLQAILERVLPLVPGAKRGAVMLQDPATKRVQVGASLPKGEVIVSETLARRVMDEGHGFILQRNNDEGVLNPKLVTVETGMYAPLLLKEKPLGAIYLDDPNHSEPFSEDDMQFLLAVGHYIAVVIQNHELQTELSHNASLLDRISVKFPPRVQERLLESIRQERLQPSLQKSELPVLFADLRGFAAVGALPPDEAAAMLRAYQTALLDVAFRYDGTLLRSFGEEFAAVFGAPEGDIQQNEKAVCAAIEMGAAIRDLNSQRRAQNLPVCELATGVHIGEVLHGFIGTPDRMEFTALGEGVTRASQYCKGAHDSELLIGPEVYQKVFKIIEADRATVTHKETGEFHCYRVKGLKSAKPA